MAPSALFSGVLTRSYLVQYSTAAEAAPVTRMVIDRRRCTIAREMAGANGQDRQGRRGGQAEVRWQLPGGASEHNLPHRAAAATMSWTSWHSEATGRVCAEQKANI